MNCKRIIPWDKRDIFHDDLTSFPLEDYFPLNNNNNETEQEADNNKSSNGGR